MPRLFSTALLFVLIGATAGAFVITEGLKLEKSPITKVVVEPKIFSPTCECDTDLMLIALPPAQGGPADARDRRQGRQPRAHARRARAAEQRPVLASWDGRDEDGAVVRDGTYRARVHLRHRTILMPNRHPRRRDSAGGQGAPHRAARASSRARD